ncbi:hypothetical protein NGG03_24700 [Klebsiella michiganensis]|uniref:hypothetical protein n=1 Tax=Klebsiella michiganensis TaxID=1134687 RepID=UPI002DBD24B4|nr:hypothetical protein [Klebsiella michiganensis]MEB8293115.1 hypothetical protein [Klebsiella michiganensis]
MSILEIVKPGTWLEGQQFEAAREIESYFSNLESAFFEANAALNLFEKELDRDYPDISVEEWEMNSARVRAEEKRLLEHEDGLELEQRGELYYQASVNVKRRKWENGEIPENILSHYILIYGKSFVYSLDLFSLILLRIKKEAWAPHNIDSICTDFYDGIPSLRDVRNSFHHQEDRAFGIGSDRKPMTIQPINNGFFGGTHGALIGASLIGRRLGTTIGNGSFVEIEISGDTLKHAQKAIHDVYNSFQWSGPKEHYPT